MNIVGITNKRNPDYPRNALWDYCVHSWLENVGNPYTNEYHTSVHCIKCFVQGENDNQTGEVYWPTT